MTIRTSTDLSPELRDAQFEILERATGYGLDFFDTIFEVVDYETMNQLAAYGGFPVRYPHWRWGMEYERLRKRDVYGMGRIYEMVINNDPCYAYLQESNSVMGQKLVMAHVYGHCDFFKCNAWFSKTHRNMMDEMANHATRIQRHAERVGADVVESFIDHCLCLEHLIDPHSMFVKRGDISGRSSSSSRGSRRGDRDGRNRDPRSAGEKWEPDRFPAKEYMDRYINPKSALEAQKAAHEERQREKQQQFPSEPVRDVLLFLLHHARLEDWQRDVLSIIRDEAYYFAPQAMTKIMNEGWATYWHSKIMTTHILDSSEIIDYADQHSGVVYMAPGGFNPYKIGLEMMKDIERRWNKGQHGPEWDSLEGLGERDRFDDGSRRGREKLFEIRRIYNDISFVEEFLTDELIDKLKMYHYRRDPRTGRNVIVSRDPRVVRQTLLYRISNMGQPFIYVVDANYSNRGELYLAHQWNGLEVDANKAVEVLRAMHSLWRRPVHLQLRVNEEMMRLTCTSLDEDGITAEKITEDMPEPTHRIA